ncbi:hypothetical protein YC2023_021287 [Brassica napus]
MATVVLPRFSASTISVPDSDPDPLFTWFSDLLSVAPPPEPPDPPDPSDSFLPLCRPYIFEASASSRRSRSSFDDSALLNPCMLCSESRTCLSSLNEILIK